ncbi:DUF6153 family protein [Actinokineospora iranica]|uniref:DUF6153 family protein n=1 Tax=Actinokineospora iranica TaxID=1271860 RepID=UPI0011142975|nr:DUF6153 family protein [Actinokineospora iranica]
MRRKTPALGRLVLLLAVLVGLLGMHALSGPQVSGLHVSSAAQQTHPADDHAPVEHGHVGPVCESGALPVHPDAVLDLPVVSAPPPEGLLGRVAWAGVAGSGCGPPARADLQVWRI